LTESAALAFEYGYSVAAPDALVLWEAQFGDFINGAQVVVDQFVVSGRPKWGQTSRLALLLPHGYEGNGPEHSSARLERFLQLAAQDNLRIVNCTTAAQNFHLLRRQALDPVARPLGVMTPKGLLRLKDASSSLGELAEGRFQPVLDDPRADKDGEPERGLSDRAPPRAGPDRARSAPAGRLSVNRRSPSCRSPPPWSRRRLRRRAPRAVGLRLPRPGRPHRLDRLLRDPRAVLARLREQPLTLLGRQLPPEVVRREREPDDTGTEQARHLPQSCHVGVLAVG